MFIYSLRKAATSAIPNQRLVLIPLISFLFPPLNMDLPYLASYTKDIFS